MPPPMKALAAAGALAAGLAGCTEPEKPQQIDASLVQPDCYTVDLYSPPPYRRPNGDVPASHSAFLGQWGGGAWNGLVCHDLWVLDVDAAGRVLMFDAHGPGFFPDATMFERVGEIDEDGRLRVRKGSAEVEYWIEDGRMFGIRRRGTQEIRIVMERRESPG